MIFVGLTVNEITLLPIYTAFVQSTSNSIADFAKTNVPNLDRLSSK
jgi:hypothetical protein